jgi:hypothetical protein
VVEDENLITWEIPRPTYVREIEPGSCYWESRRSNQDSQEFDAAKMNRQLLEDRKITAQSYKKRAAEIVLGKTA